MNSKEALKMLYKNCPMVVTRESDGVQLYSEYLIEVIKRDLDRLEQLEKERQEVETRLSSKETNTFDEIATMIKKAYDYDVLVNKCKQLENENQELKEQVDEFFDGNALRQIKINSLEDENTKLKKALGILKDFFVIGKINEDYLINATGFNRLTQEDYELLKEVLDCE